MRFLIKFLWSSLKGREQKLRFQSCLDPRPKDKGAILWGICIYTVIQRLKEGFEARNLKIPKVKLMTNKTF